MTRKLLGLLAIVHLTALTSHASIITIRELVPDPGGVDEWSVSTQTGAGTAGLVDLTPIGGTLDSTQPGGPMPGGTNPGVARLTTGADNQDRAELGTYQDFGLASSVLADVDLSYSYYKEPVGAVTPAPSLKLDVYNPGASGDGYGQLIYEPYWQGSNPPTGSWESVVIDENTGSGVDGSGGWWWTGGFGIGSGAGGPPLRSLAEWDAAFASAAPADYAGAHITAIRVGLGSYNQDQVGYFDDVSFASGGIDVTYSFAVPEPSTYFSVGLLFAVCIIFMMWRRKRDGAEAEASNA